MCTPVGNSRTRGGVGEARHCREGGQRGDGERAIPIVRAGAYPGCRPTGPRPHPHSPTGPPPPGYASRQPCLGLPPRTAWPTTSNTQPGPPNLLHGSSLYLHRIQVHRPHLPRGLASSLEQKQGNPITVFQILSPPHTVLGTRPSLPDNRLNPWGTFGVHGFCRKLAGPRSLCSL